MVTRIEMMIVRQIPIPPMRARAISKLINSLNSELIVIPFLKYKTKLGIVPQM